MRMVGEGDPRFENRAHFFSAAAEAMRRTLVDSARRKHALKRGSGVPHEELEEDCLAQALPDEELLAVDEALDLPPFLPLQAQNDTTRRARIRPQVRNVQVKSDRHPLFGDAHRSQLLVECSPQAL